MNNSFHTSQYKLNPQQLKGGQIFSNILIDFVFEAFYWHEKTVSMVVEETGATRRTVLYYVKKWEKKNCAKVVREGICPVSRRRANFYATNPDLFPSIVEPLNPSKRRSRNL